MTLHNKLEQLLLELIEKTPKNAPEKLQILYKIMIRDLFFTFHITPAPICQCGCGKKFGCISSGELYHEYGLGRCKRSLRNFDSSTYTQEITEELISEVKNLTFEKFKLRLMFTQLVVKK